MLKPEEFGTFIQQLRKEEHMTQAELAQKLHVSDKAISKWERGAGLPDLTNMEALADVFGLSMAELLRCRKEPTGTMDSGEVAQVINTTLDVTKYHSDTRLRKQRRLLFASAFTVTLGLFLIYGLSALMNLIYYNPCEVAAYQDYGEPVNRLTMDWNVYSELLLPENRFQSVRANARKYGTYDIELVQNISYVNEFRNVGGKIERGRLLLYDPNVIRRPAGNLFAGFNLPGTGTVNERVKQNSTGLTGNESLVYWFYRNQEEADTALEQLADSTFYYAYISLDQALPYKDLRTLIQTLPSDTEAIWCAAVTNSYNQYQMIGFSVKTSGLIQSFYLDRYPYLNPAKNAEPASDPFVLNDRNLEGSEYMNNHLADSMQYLLDRPGFLKMMNENPDSLKDALSYVRSNPLTIYGFTVRATGADLKTIRSLNHIYGIITTPVQ